MPMPPTPKTQTHRNPAMKNRPTQTSETSIVWPKSGSRMSGMIVAGSSSSAMRLPGSRSRPPSAKAQAARTTKQGFMNSDGWTPKIQRRAPLTSCAEKQRREDQRHRDNEKDERGAAHMPGRQQRGGEEDGE